MQETLWPPGGTEPLGPGAALLRGFAQEAEAELLQAIAAIAEAAPFRHLTTPGGHVMSVAMTNAGPLGWVSDRRGYRYEPCDPLSAQPWPPIPGVLLDLARRAAEQAGFADYPTPDACLVNRYETGARLSLHQDLNERQRQHPIVSVSLGVPAVFIFGGLQRGDPTRRLRLHGGDVVVFGGASRMAYHGIAPLASGQHRLTGALRYNLTLRHAA